MGEVYRPWLHLYQLRGGRASFHEEVGVGGVSVGVSVDVEGVQAGCRVKKRRETKT